MDVNYDRIYKTAYDNVKVSGSRKNFVIGNMLNFEKQINIQLKTTKRLQEKLKKRNLAKSE